MTPGTIIQAGEHKLLTLFPLEDDSRTVCVLVSVEPYVGPQGFCDIVISGEDQYYLVPGIALLSASQLKNSTPVGEADQDQVQAIAYSHTIMTQVGRALWQERMASQ